MIVYTATIQRSGATIKVNPFAALNDAHAKKILQSVENCKEEEISLKIKRKSVFKKIK